MITGLLSNAVAHDYESLRPNQLEAALAKAPIAYVPVGVLEFHGPHLPLGVDILIPDRLLRRVVLKTGGVVLPPLYIGAGVLHLPYSLNFPLDVLRTSTRALIQQLTETGLQVIVLMSGHGALDHLQVLREECDRLMREHSGVSAIATCWSELTADVEGDINDHGAKVETSYMLELCGELVELNALSSDAQATHIGVYGSNPRFTASKEWGALLADRVVEALVELVEGALAGKRVDNWGKLRALVHRLQSGDLVILPDSGHLGDAGFRFELENPHPQSKYITAVSLLEWDGRPLDPANLIIRNRAAGDHREQVANRLSPLSGFYIRRQQRLECELPSFCPQIGQHHLALKFELAGVMSIGAAGTIKVALM